VKYFVLAVMTLTSVACRPVNGGGERSFAKLADVYAEPSAEVTNCQKALEAPKCSGAGCGTLALMNSASGLLMSPEHPRKYQYGTSGFAQMIRHAAGITRCITTAWKNNGKEIVVGDVADRNAKTPANRHPGGSHDGGINADISYFQLEYADNLMREVCPHADNHCTGDPRYLDPYKTAVFIAGMHRNENLRLVGVDGRIGKPLINATKDLCRRGVIKGNACRGLKLVYEETNQGNGWYRFHHHHMHVRLGTSATANMVTIGTGSTDNNALWYDPEQPAAGDSDTGQTDAAAAPLVPEKPAEQAETCYVGFLKNSDQKRLCSAFQGKDRGSAAKYFVSYGTDECRIETLAVHLQRDKYNELVGICNGKYVPHENEPETPVADNDIWVALTSDDAGEMQALAISTREITGETWICPDHDVQKCLSQDMAAKLIRTDRLTSPSSRRILKARSAVDITAFTVFNRDDNGRVTFRKLKAQKK
jgi:hypothetical protein